MLYVTGIDSTIPTADVRDFIFENQNLNDSVRRPADLVLYRYGTAENPKGERLDLKKTLAEQGVVDKGDLYMVVRLIEAAGRSKHLGHDGTGIS